jgi:hypothetical protein
MKQKKFASRMAVAASVLALAATAVMASAPAASAAPANRPAVSFSFTQPTVDSGVRPQLAYSGRNLPAGSRIILEVAYGSPARWDPVRGLNGRTGTATLPSLPSGLYHFRAVAERGVTVVAISPTRYLSVVQPASSTCGICAILGGVGGAIMTWLLRLLPW